MLNKFDKWCERQEEKNNYNNWWFMLPATFLYFGLVICFIKVIINLFGG